MRHTVKTGVAKWILSSNFSLSLARFACLSLFLSIWFSNFAIAAISKVSPIELTQKTAETQIRHLIEPLLEKYCQDSCRLLGISISVDLANSEEVSPGFDESAIRKANELAPTSGTIKLLIDDKVGPVSKTKLLELLQQYLDTLDYPIKIQIQTAHFPIPEGSEARISELRTRISKQFLDTIQTLLNQFCRDHCTFVDYDIQTEAVNTEETQFGSTEEFLQEGNAAIHIKSISGTILMDDTLSREEQNNILEMAKLKTNGFKHVSLNVKSMKFPHVYTPSEEDLAGRPYSHTSGNLKKVIADGTSTNSDSKSTSTDRSTSSATTSANNSATNTANTTATTSENTSSNSTRQEKLERIEKIERVENGNAVQAELQKFKVYGLIFGTSVLALLIFIALSNFRPISQGSGTNVHRIIQSIASEPMSLHPDTLSNSEDSGRGRDRHPHADSNSSGSSNSSANISTNISKRYETELLIDELTSVYAQQPKVAKHVFSRVLTEEGVETTSAYIHIFGEGIVVDMLRDPSLQADIVELMDYYSKNVISLNNEDEKLDLLKRLHNKTVASKLAVIGNRSSSNFDFLTEMDGLQVLELIQTESVTVKAIILTQCDSQKRSVVYSLMDPEIRMQLLTELSRIDYLPRDYIFNVASALKRKKRENPKLNTEALPGSEVLVSLLERTGHTMQRSVIQALGANNPDSARTVMNKLVSIDTLRYLRDGQLLEVVLSLKHDELIHFLKGAPEEIKTTIYSKSPKDLVFELEDELSQTSTMSRETYLAVERKLLNRMKIMANEGHINLIETNERMFASSPPETAFVQPSSGIKAAEEKPKGLKKVAGW
jgi:flagellar motor switch protein FliG